MLTLLSEWKPIASSNLTKHPSHCPMPDSYVALRSLPWKNFFSFSITNGRTLAPYPWCVNLSCSSNNWSLFWYRWIERRVFHRQGLKISPGNLVLCKGYGPEWRTVWRVSWKVANPADCFARLVAASCSRQTKEKSALPGPAKLQNHSPIAVSSWVPVFVAWAWLQVVWHSYSTQTTTPLRKWRHAPTYSLLWGTTTEGLLRRGRETTECLCLCICKDQLDSTNLK